MIICLLISDKTSKYKRIFGDRYKTDYSELIMYSGVKNFLSRHKRKLVVGGVIAGGIIAVRYAQRKLLQYQEDKTREFIDRTRRAQHFETTERTCNQAIMGLAPNLIDRILKCLDTDPLLEKLRSNPDNKIELWNDVKILVFSRLTALVYICSMLVVTLRIQFNILGGYLYKDTISNDSIIPNDVQQHYVALVQYLLKDGIETLCNMIQGKARHVLSTIDLSHKLTLAETEQIFWSIQLAVNSDAMDPNSNIAMYVFSADVTQISTNPIFNQMYTETVDMLESDEISALNTNNVSRGFSIVMDNIADFYSKPLNGVNSNALIRPANVDVSVPSTSKASLNANYITEIHDNGVNTIDANDTSITNINAVTMPLPKLIPIINGLAKQHFNSTSKPPGLSTSLVTLYLISDKIKMLGANVYEVFSQ